MCWTQWSEHRCSRQPWAIPKSTFELDTDLILGAMYQVYSAFPTVSCFFLFLVFILVLSSYVFILIYFWVGGLFLLFEDAAKNRLCSPEMHVWLAVALLQPIMNGVLDAFSNLPKWT
eukprot:s1340_g15.t1